MTEKTFDTIVSCLINSKLDAERDNVKGINDAYIHNIEDALEELKKMKETK